MADAALLLCSTTAGGMTGRISYSMDLLGVLSRPTGRGPCRPLSEEERELTGPRIHQVVGGGTTSRRRCGIGHDARVTELPVGSVLAGLRIEGVLGRGGMGVVHLAFDPELDRRVAVKVIAREVAADPDFRRRFRRESRTAAAVHHPHVIPIHRAGDEDGLLFLVMHYVAGPDLRELIEQSGKLAPELVATVITQVAGALDAAHRRDLVHRDVKPSNILVATDGDMPHAYLTDFGLARRAHPTDPITGTGMLVGSLNYMAPELFDRGPASVASDVYALGCVVFHALSGTIVYPRENVGALVAAHVYAAPPTLNAAVPDLELRAALDAVVATALAKRPQDRFASAGALAAALRSAVDGAKVPRPAGAPTIPPAPDGRTVTWPPADVPRFIPPEEPEPMSRPADGPPPTPRRLVRLISVALLAAAVAAGAVVTIMALTRPQPTGPAGPSPDEPVIVLAPPIDNGGSVQLTWTGPDTLDYGVELSSDGGQPRTLSVRRSTTLTVPVDPGLGYCFRVRGTDGQAVYTSNAQPLRGAGCES